MDADSPSCNSRHLAQEDGFQAQTATTHNSVGSHWPGSGEKRARLVPEQKDNIPSLPEVELEHREWDTVKFWVSTFAWDHRVLPGREVLTRCLQRRFDGAKRFNSERMYSDYS
ncbi:hypothetical protein CISG_07247 [Coccidioides immitis RMSCC 3703]|uniref:Uncharacterized protein n=1 Tax=Coccidioides immitis RMSCC 3703 TaxID=454286 RepID=A0A0J8R2Y8_COCIT|nr:hypothetical protein CISG_07247 [Coccidioides immitis RMSCC 3703]